jgi:hypothetical protein
MIQFGLHGFQTGFDIPQAFPIGKLSEGHAEILIEATEFLYFVMAAVSVHAFSKLMEWKKFHQLRKDGLALIHGSFHTPSGIGNDQSIITISNRYSTMPL